jgi:hypothetical protein
MERTSLPIRELSRRLGGSHNEQVWCQLHDQLHDNRLG